MPGMYGCICGVVTLFYDAPGGGNRCAVFVQHLLQPVLVVSGTPVPDPALPTLSGPNSPHAMVLLKVGLSKPVPLNSRPRFFNSRCIEMSCLLCLVLSVCVCRAETSFIIVAFRITELTAYLR